MTLRPDGGTYGKYDYRALPPLPFALSGDLAWLAAQNEAGEWRVGEGPAPALPALSSRCADLGLSLPPAFVTFMSTPELQRRIRSCTGCYLDLTAHPVQLPTADGYLIRFLADQQGCLFWYLYLTPDGDHAVLCSPRFHGDPDQDDEGDENGEDDDWAETVFCGESFEAFLYRYWLENEIWYAATENTAMPDGAAEYLAQYQATAQDASQE